MAEAPEVEVLAQDLRARVAGRPMTAVAVIDPAAVRFGAPDGYAALLTGRTIAGATRWAKHLWLPLGPAPGDTAPLALEIHLMLFGTLALVSTTAALAPTTLITWTLDGGEELRLLDRLGYARSAAGPAGELIERLDLATLGPDALAPDFAPQTLRERLYKRRGVLKTVLLNQRIVAGLGNRDADESLWLAAIDPRRSAASLSDEETLRLHAAMRAVLDEGLALRGTQRDLSGRKGAALHGRYVFERSGSPCPRCGTRIAVTRIGGRNTHFCPHCQQ